MAKDSIHVSALIPASPQAVYDAWLSSEDHAKMTGEAATIEPHVGGKHSAWAGYISGETLELDPGKRIVQSWYAADFPEGSEPSRIVVEVEPEGDGTRLTIDHFDVPGGHGDRFTEGWQKFYIAPMTAHFGAGAAMKAAPKKKATAKKATAKKATAKKAATKKAAAKKVAKKPAAKKPAAKKPATKKAPAKKPAAKKPVAKKAPAKKAAKKAAPKKVAKKAP